VIRTPGVVRVLATTLLGILAGYLAYTYVAAISQAGAAASGESLAVVLIAFGAGATCGALLSGAGVDRYGQPLTARAGAGLQAVSLAALGAIVGAHLGVILLATGFAVLGAGTFNYGATPQRRLIALAPEQATTLVSLNNSAIYVGMSLSGALGALTLRAGPVANCVAGALIATVAAAIAAPLRRRGGGSS
jgi:predicted MFS family arabinose efflux permease